MDGAGKTVSTTVHRALSDSAELVHMELLPSDLMGRPGNLVTVSSGGAVACFDVDTLAEVWTESSTSLLQNSIAEPQAEYRISFATATTAIKDSEWLVDMQPGKAAARDDGLVIGLVASCTKDGQDKRYILVLGAAASAASTFGQRLTPIQVAPLPNPDGRKRGESAYHVDFSSGHLMELLKGRMLVYNLSATVPKLDSSSMVLDGARDMLPLSPQTVLICSHNSLSVYNHVYRWTQAQLTFNASDLVGRAASLQGCTIVEYFGGLDIAVALIGNSIVSIPIEAPQRSSRKRQFDGRLIDAIGQGDMPQQDSPDAAYVAAKIRRATKQLKKQNHVEFERILADEFGVTTKPVSRLAQDDETHEALEWKWHAYAHEYRAVANRWIAYAISSALSLHNEGDDGSSCNSSCCCIRLTCTLPSDNVMTYLVVAGHLTLANLRTGLKTQLSGAVVHDSDLCRELVRVMIDMDPTMQLLVTYIAATHVGATELLVAVKAFMDSLGVAEQQKTAKLLTNEAHEATEREQMTAEGEADGGAADVDEMVIDQLENELAVVMFHFTEDESNIRGRGLTLALAKLGSCPTATTVQAIRRVFSTDQILSLILILRQELVSGAWTTRYVDQSFFEEHGVEPPPDGNVSLIANLLSRCLDAVGARAWFLNDDVTFGDHNEAGSFLDRLSIDVRAALEGLQEAVYLNGILGEAVRYGTAAAAAAQEQRRTLSAATAAAAVQSKGTSGTTGQDNSDRPKGDIQEMRTETRDANMLPLGAPSPQKIDLVYVNGVGGQLRQRSMREIAIMKSKKVGPYALERLLV